ncbi:MAG: hypothetical protein SFY69_01315 [Planctomycetota bacterium]|nr:hypothetical protein [Planctomycetota bacterium]
MAKVWSFVLAGLVGGAAIGVWTAPAHAQERVMITRSMSSAGGGQISKRAVERYAAAVGFTAEQSEFARTIHEAYVAGMEQAQKTRRQALEEARRAGEDTGDHGVFMERMPAIEKEFRAKSQAMEKSFFEDVHALLSPEQEDRWVKVERMRRREVGLRAGTLAGESVDLSDLVASLSLAPEEAASIAPTLDEYEADLDRHMQERARLMADEREFSLSPRGGDPEEGMRRMQESMKAGRELGVKIRGTNEQYARRVASMLREEPRQAFERELQKRSFPLVYRQSRVSRELEGALALDDLRPEQRDDLRALREQYERDAGAANDRWAGAIREAEQQENAGAIATPMGVMRISMGDEPEGLVEARKARRAVDEQASTRLRSILTPGQLERLPKASEERGEGEMVTEGTFVIEGMR